MEIAEFRKEMADLANLYDWHLFKDEKLKRLFSRITDIGTAVQDDTAKQAKVGETIDLLYKKKTKKLSNQNVLFFLTILLLKLQLFNVR